MKATLYCAWSLDRLTAACRRMRSGLTSRWSISWRSPREPFIRAMASTDVSGIHARSAVSFTALQRVVHRFGRSEECGATRVGAQMSEERASAPVANRPVEFSDGSAEPLKRTLAVTERIVDERHAGSGNGSVRGSRDKFLQQRPSFCSVSAQGVCVCQQGHSEGLALTRQLDGPLRGCDRVVVLVLCHEHHREADCEDVAMRLSERLQAHLSADAAELAKLAS